MGTFTQTKKEIVLCTLAFDIPRDEYQNWFDWIHRFLADLIVDIRIEIHDLSIIENFSIVQLWSNLQDRGAAVAVEFSLLKIWQEYISNRFIFLKSQDGSVSYLRRAHRIFCEMNVGSNDSHVVSETTLLPHMYAFCGKGRVHQIEYSYKQLQYHPELANNCSFVLMNSKEALITVVPQEIRLIEKVKRTAWTIEVIVKHPDLVLKLYFDSSSVKVGRYSLARIKQ